MAARRRTAYPDLPQAAAAQLNAVHAELAQDTASLRDAAIGSTTDTKTGDYSARYNEAIRCQMSSAGGALTFPAAAVGSVDKWIEVILLGGGPVKVQPTGGLVDGAASVSLTQPGRYMFRSDGLSSWWRATGGPPALGSVTLAMLATQAANTIVANATAAAASPTAFPVGLNTVVGRGPAGNIVAAQLVGSQVTAATLTNALLATMAANTIKANATGGAASPADVACGAESVFGQTSGNLQGIASAVQTALIRGSGSVFWASCASNQVLRRSGAGDLGFGTLVDGNMSTNTLTAASQAQMAANTVKCNPTAALANEADLAVGANQVVGRQGGNLAAFQVASAQVGTNALAFSNLPQGVARSVVCNPTNALADFQAMQGTVRRAYLRVSDAGTALEFGNLADAVKNAATVVSALTTVLATTGTYSVPANSVAVGSRFACEFTYQFVRGATATALNLSSFFNIGGSNVSTAIASQIAAGTYHLRVQAELTILTTGAGGTCMATLTTYGTASTVAGGVSATANIALAFNSTIANNLSGAAQMSAPVAGTTITATGGHIRPLAY